MKFITFLLPLFTCMASLHALSYELVNLGFEHKKQSCPTSINDNGLIVGTYLEGSTHYTFVHNALDQQTAVREIRLGSSSTFVDNNDEVVGSMLVRDYDGYWKFDAENVYQWKSPFSYFQFFHFYNHFKPVETRSAPYDFKSTVVFDINDRGQYLITNHSSIASATDELTTPEPLFWVFEDGTFNRIQHPLITMGVAINNHDQILGVLAKGSVYHNNRQQQCVIYNLADREVEVLEFPAEAVGYSINDLGEVAGVYFNLEESMYMGFLHRSGEPCLSIPNFTPVKMNNQSQMIGEYIYAEKRGRPAIFSQGELYDVADLTSLIDNQGRVWDSLNYLYDINNHGWIVGQGKVEGKKCAFLLKPLLEEVEDLPRE